MRRELVDYLRTYGSDGDDYEAAELILGELLSNAGRYTPGPVCVAIDWTDRHPRAIVHDGGRGFAWTPFLPHDAAERGRGLYIVSTLALDVRVETAAHGCRVSATLPVARPDDARVDVRPCAQSRRPDANGVCRSPRQRGGDTRALQSNTG